MNLDLFTNLLYIQSEVDFVAELYNLSPIIGCLILAVVYLVYQIYHKEKQLTELNKYIRDESAENMKTLETVCSTMDKVLDQYEKGNTNITKDINNLKEIIILKLDNLK